MTFETRPRLIGSRIKRIEDPRLLTGQGNFVDDRQVPRLLHIAFRRSDQSHAHITRIDIAAAATMPGVVTIFTAADFEGEFTPPRATSRMVDYHSTPIYPLARQKVRYVGEPLVAVVAESRYLAEDAAEQINIELDTLPVVIDPEAAMQPGAPLLHEEAGTNVLVTRAFSRGNIEADLAVAAVRVGGRFRFHRKTPAAIENRAYLADYDAGRKVLTLTSTTNVPGVIRDVLAEALDMPGNRLRVIAPDVGGSFGGKASFYPEELLVCLAARRLRRPVKWTSDRLEDLTSTSQAFDEIVDAELGLDRDGRILALWADVISNIGAFSIYPWTAALEPAQVISFLPGPYRVPTYSGKARGVATSKPPTGPYRGVGRPIAAFVMERLVDMAARKLALDPKELRLRNLIQDHEFPYKSASGIIWDRSAFVGGLESACTAIGYDALREEQAAARAAGRWRGIGIGSYVELTGIGSAISAAPGTPVNTGTETSSIRIDSTGAVTAAFGISSHGQGLETTLAQVIAQELGVRLEDITIVQGDSAAVAHGTGTFASRSAVLAGGAATLASRALRVKVLRVASILLEAAEGDLEIAEGKIFVTGTDRQITFSDVARAAYTEIGQLPKDARGDLEATKLYDPFFGTASSATHIAVVDIDPETYEIAILRYVVAEDCGRLINPAIVDGQVHGGVAQGIGAALYEEVAHDERGQILSASFVDYVVPSAAEIPAIDVLHVESALPQTIGGFRGMGEGGTIGAPAAIANAVADALAPLGVEIHELPITPQRLFHLINDAKEKS